jgi:hypothetical protein
MNLKDIKTIDLVTSFNSKLLFKLVLYCTVGVFIPISLISGMLAFYGVVPANLNDQKYVGLQGLLVFLLMSPIYIVILTGAQWLSLAIGLKIIKMIIALVRRFKSKN